MLLRRRNLLPWLTAVVCVLPALAHAGEPPSRAASDELLRPASVPATQPSFEPTTAYEARKLEGWPILVNKQLLANEPDLASRTLRLLEAQLYQITRVVPGPALAHLKTITIWVDRSDPLVPCMCYHSSRDWVASHGLNPEKAHCVELANPKNFLGWTREQPWMVLHELSHGYHDRFLPDGFDNKEVVAAYEAARDAKLYDAVLRCNGHVERAYAMTNQMEYFAECSEAFFGTNDFYPFVAIEFEKHDPKGFETLKSLWGR